MLTPINPEGAKSLFTVVFDKTDGSYVAALSLPMSALGFDRSLYEGREVQFNQLTDYIDGGLTINEDGTFTDSFVVRNVNDRPTTIVEKELNYATQAKITDQYPITEQLNLISKSILELANRAGVDLPELDTMHNFISTQLSANALLKKSYAEDPNVVYESDSPTNLEAGGLVKITRTGRVFKTDE